MYRTEIDGLRAIAVMAVIVHHIDRTLLPQGHLGVDIFYVISGFVITQSLIKRPHCSFGGYILGFYTRRVKRLIPALFVCIALTALAVFAVSSPDATLTKASIRTGVTALFGLSNFYLLRHATDYFGSSALLNPFTHTWSLSVEAQFYLVFPFILWLSGLSQKRSDGVRNFTLIIWMTAIASLVSYIWLNNQNPIMAFYLMPSRFWELAVGAIGCLALSKHRNTTITHHRFTRHITFFALVAVIVVLFLPRSTSYPGLGTFAVVILTVVFICSIRPATLAYGLMTLKPLVFLGVISYSLYLWHWSVLTISRLTIGIDSRTIPFQLATIFILSVLSYQLVEKPLRASEWPVLKIGNIRLGAVGHSVTCALGLAAAILLVAATFHQQGYLYTGNIAPLIKKGVQTLDDRQVFLDDTWEGNRCVLSSNDDVGKVIRPEDCTFGSFMSAKRRFLVIGNSFSAAEIDMYLILVHAKRGSVTVTSSWGASEVPEIKNQGIFDKANNYYWTSVIPSLIDQLQPGDVLLMVNDGAGFSPPKHTQRSKQKIRVLRKGLERIIQEMAQRGIGVIYQSGNPFMRESGCTPDTAMPQWWHFQNDPPCKYYTREESLRRRRLFHETLLELQQKFSNFAVLDLFDLFCPGEICRFFDDKGIFLYRDKWSHSSVEANILAQPLLLETVDKLLSANPHPAGEG